MPDTSKMLRKAGKSNARTFRKDSDDRLQDSSRITRTNPETDSQAAREVGHRE